MNLFFLLAMIMISPSFSWASTFSEEDHIKKATESPSASVPKSEKAVWGIAEEQLDELFNLSSDLVCLADNRFLYRMNAAWTEMLGWREQELLIRPYIDDVHPDNQDSTKRIIHQGIQNSLIHSSKSFDPSDTVPKNSIMINFENRCRAQQGNYRTFQWLILLQISGPKTSAPLLCIAKDVTEQKQAEEQKLALEQAQAATKIKSTFVAHMSHEIRTPLNGILGFIELALDEQVSDKVHTYLNYAHDSALLLLEIANDIIDVSRIEAGALKIDKVDFNPLEVFDNVLNILKLQVAKKKIDLTFSVSSSLPMMLRGDQIRFKQILLNLGSNALKFIPQGKVSFKIEGQAHPKQASLFLLRGKVKDTGMGMEPAFIQQLFQPFSQEHRPLNPQVGGAGLGLYITKQLCEKMGGFINAVSTPGLGSTFQFQVVFERPKCSSPSLQKHRLSLNSIRLPFSRVLVVDDNSMNQKVLKEILTRLSCTVDIVENGLKALEAVRHKSYEMVFMDGEMPDMDGLEATQKIREQFSAKELPIIGLTAHAMTNHREQFLEAGMNGYLTKPIDRKKLIKEIFRCWEDLNKVS